MNKGLKYLLGLIVILGAHSVSAQPAAAAPAATDGDGLLAASRTRFDDAVKAYEKAADQCEAIAEVYSSAADVRGGQKRVLDYSAGIVTAVGGGVSTVFGAVTLAVQSNASADASQASLANLAMWTTIAGAGIALVGGALSLGSTTFYGSTLDEIRTASNVIDDEEKTNLNTVLEREAEVALLEGEVLAAELKADANEVLGAKQALIKKLGPSSAAISAESKRLRVRCNAIYKAAPITFVVDKPLSDDAKNVLKGVQ